MSIIIFSRPVRSGKTTELIKWCDIQQDVSGILMPDINGSRKIMNIKTGDVFDAECMEPENTDEELLQVGRFSFYASAFNKANELLLENISHSLSWLVIDEVGKLELGKKGLFPSVESAVNQYQFTSGKKAIFVIRDTLVESAISFFNITEYTLIHDLFQQSRRNNSAQEEQNRVGGGNQ
jgi:nucleoside-triphosphatase THEP1